MNEIPEADGSGSERRIVFRHIKMEFLLDLGLRHGFVTFVPTFDVIDSNLFKQLVTQLMDAGCGEFVFVGEKAFDYHDQADDIIEDYHGKFVLTSCFSEMCEGLDYFLYGAGAALPDLLALISDYPEFKAKIENKFLEIHQRKLMLKTSD